MIQDEQHDYYLDDLMNEITAHLVDGAPKDAAQGLFKLASYFAKAGMPMSSFLNMRKHLVDQAIETSGSAYFIDEKLRIAEEELTKIRTGKSSLIIVH